MNKRKLIGWVAIAAGLAVLLAGCSKKTEQELLQEAQKSLSENKYAEAIDNYNQLIKSYPNSQNSPRAYFNMGAINLVYLNDQESAEKAWEKLQKAYPQFDLAKEFFDYAQKLQDEGKFELAIRLYDEISKFLPQGPNREKALFLKGFVYSEELKDYVKAREIYQQFIQDYPESELKDDAEYMLENMDKEPEWGK